MDFGTNPDFLDVDNYQIRKTDVGRETRTGVLEEHDEPTGNHTVDRRKSLSLTFSRSSFGVRDTGLESVVCDSKNSVTQTIFPPSKFLTECNFSFLQYRVGNLPPQSPINTYINFWWCHR